MKGKRKGEQSMVKFDAEEDLKSFNAEKGRLIKERGTKAGDEEDEEAAIMRQLFVTQEEDEIEEFEKEKEEEVEEIVGSKVAKQTIMQGWGSWAGEGVDNSRHEMK